MGDKMAIGYSKFQQIGKREKPVKEKKGVSCTKRQDERLISSNSATADEQGRRATTPFLKKHKPIKRVSKKHKVELAKRRKLKAELIMESKGKCMTCKKKPDWRGLSLSHIIPLSRGGKTTRGNCLAECFPCHIKFEKHPEKRTEVED